MPSCRYLVTPRQYPGMASLASLLQNVPSPPLLVTCIRSRDSVCFDVQEEVVVGGATSGTIKLWDLDQGKAIRTLVGHRSDCQTVEFHPFGAFFASGSLDTNLKV